jgi:hypothetical protein
MPFFSRQLLVRHRLTLSLVGCLLSGLLSTPAIAQLPGTQLSSLFPPGGQRGAELDVRIAGGDQDDVDRLLFSHPKITASPKMTAGDELAVSERIPAQFHVQIAADVPSGVYEARVVGRFGVSNPRAFSVGEFKELVDRGGNSRKEESLGLEVSRTVSGTIDNESRDYFKISLDAGQRVLIDCAAQRIDSRLDASIVMADHTGRELLRSNDYRGTDPFLDFTAPTAGEYFLTLFDCLYRGGGDYFYRLTVHSGPHVDFVFPPSGVAGSDDSYTVYGRNLPGGHPSEVSCDGVQLEQLQVNLPIPARDKLSGISFASAVQPATSLLDSVPCSISSITPVTLFVASQPISREQEPNDEPEQACLVSVPCEVVGQFYQPRDVDCIRFEAKQGSVYSIDALAHRLGQDIDPRFLIHKITTDAKGQTKEKLLVNVDDSKSRNQRIGADYDTSTDDPAYRLVVDEDAIYRVMLWDQSGSAQADPRRLYRLVVREEQPDFRLVVVPIALGTPANQNVVRLGAPSLRQSGTTMFSVVVERLGGFAGDIHVEAEGLPAGVRCRGAVLGARMTAANLIFEASPDATTWAGAIRVAGRANIGGEEVVRQARAGAAVWGTGNRQQDPPVFRATRDIVLAVMGEPAPALVDVDNKIWETSRGGTVEIPIRVTRGRDFKGDLTLACNNLPKELTPKNITVKGEDTESKLALAATHKNARPGNYTFFLRADSTAKLVRNSAAVPTAEAALQDIVAKVKQLELAKQQAKEAAESAILQAETAEKQLQLAEQEESPAAERALAAAKAARAAKELAEKTLSDSTAFLERAKKAQAARNKRLEEAKKANAPKDIKFVTISTPIRLRVVDTPLSLSLNQSAESVPKGGEVSVSIHLQRQYGFAEQVEIIAEIPKGVTGLAIETLTLKKEVADGQLLVSVAENATAGEHTVTIRAKAKFNKLDVNTVAKLVVKIEGS